MIGRTAVCHAALVALVALAAFALPAFARPTAASLTTTTYSSGPLAATIPDTETVDRAITVADEGVVRSLRVSVRVDHPVSADLELQLVGPDGTTATLSAYNGNGADYGAGAADCSGTFAVFDDRASVPVVAGESPFAGAFKPEDRLSAFAGKATAGAWALQVADDFDGDAGVLHCWKLDLSYEAASPRPPSGNPAPPGPPVPPPAASPSPQPALSCDPRPPVQVSVTRVGGGQLQVRVAAIGAGNRIQEIRFGTGNNALVDVPGRAEAATGSFAHRPPAALEHMTFVVKKRAAEGGAMIPLTVVDSCGEWQTFVGGGADAF